VPSDRMQLYSKVIRPVQDYRVNQTRWCVLRWPTPSMAQAASMSRQSDSSLRMLLRMQAAAPLFLSSS